MYSVPLLLHWFDSTGENHVVKLYYMLKKYIKYNMHFNFVLCIYPLLGIHVNSKQIKSLDPKMFFFLRQMGFLCLKKTF